MEFLVGILFVVYGFIGLSVVVLFICDYILGSGFGIVVVIVVLIVMILLIVILFSVDVIKFVLCYYWEVLLVFGVICF